MKFTSSRIQPEIDFDAEGKHVGFLRIPHSVHRSAYGWLPMPVVSIRNGDGPRVLLMSGNHGDEYEGQVALGRLARTLEPDAMRGHVIILTMANYPAAHAGTRTSPIDGGNLNRSFPGNRNGSVTEMIAHMIEEELMPHVDLVADLHSGGSSLMYIPSTQVQLTHDGNMDSRERELVEAYGAPDNHVMLPGDDNHSTGAARRKGCLFISAEFAGSGTVTPEALNIAEQGLARMLYTFGVLNELPDGIGAPTPPRHLLIKGDEHYVYAHDTGLYAPLVSLGDEVNKGDQAAAVHFPETPWQEPVIEHFKGDGVVVCKRIPGRCERGDCLFHLASHWASGEL